MRQGPERQRNTGLNRREFLGVGALPLAAGLASKNFGATSIGPEPKRKTTQSAQAVVRVGEAHVQEDEEVTKQVRRPCGAPVSRAGNPVRIPNSPPRICVDERNGPQVECLPRVTCLPRRPAVRCLKDGP